MLLLITTLVSKEPRAEIERQSCPACLRGQGAQQLGLAVSRAPGEGKEADTRGGELDGGTGNHWQGILSAGNTESLTPSPWEPPIWAAQFSW